MNAHSLSATNECAIGQEKVGVNTNSSPQYSIVVATRDRGAKIVRLIESVMNSSVDNYELVIVDQSSTDDTKNSVAPFLIDRHVTYIHTTTPGTSHARNLGISLTTGPYIAITDDDCIVPPDWLTKLSRPFEQEPRVGVVFCSVVPVPVAALGFTPSIVFSKNRIFKTATGAWLSSTNGLSLGAGMAIRRAMLENVPGFDESMGPGAKFGAAEDNDFSWRGLLRGWWTFQNAGVCVVHDGFRPIEELKALVMRDFYGVGGAVAKYLRTGKWQIVWFLGGWVVRFGVILPARDLIAGRRPKGFRRPYMLLLGVRDGLRTPLRRADLTYQRPTGDG